MNLFFLRSFEVKCPDIVKSLNTYKKKNRYSIHSDFYPFFEQAIIIAPNTHYFFCFGFMSGISLNIKNKNGSFKIKALTFKGLLKNLKKTHENCK